jgi:hypothetical protein
MTDRKNDLDALIQETMAITKSIPVEPSVPRRTIVEPPVIRRTQSATGFYSAFRTSRRTKCASRGNASLQRPC